MINISYASKLYTIKQLKAIIAQADLYGIKIWFAEGVNLENIRSCQSCLLYESINSLIVDSKLTITKLSGEPIRITPRDMLNTIMLIGGYNANEV